MIGNRTHGSTITHYCGATCHQYIAAPRYTVQDAHTTCHTACRHDEKPLLFPGVCARTHANIPGQPQIARPQQRGLHVMKPNPCSTALLQDIIAYACKHHMHSRSMNEHSFGRLWNCTCPCQPDPTGENPVYGCTHQHRPL